MSTIVIAGAGGLGRELYDWIETSPRWRRSLGVTDVVFIADGTPQHPLQRPLRSSLQDYRPQPSDQVLVAIGDPHGRAAATSALGARGARFATFIHDSAVVTAAAQNFEGAILCPHVVIGHGATFGRQVLVNANSYVGHDSFVDDFVTVSPGCSLGGKVTVRSHAFLGIGATVLPSVTVGARSLIGAGATVVDDIEPDVVAIGTPARQLTPNA